MSIIQNKIKALLSAFVLAYLLMLLSPALFGVLEPWDINGVKFVLYLAILFVIGIISSIVSKCSYWFSILGSIIGQLFYVIINLEGGPLVFIGASFIATYSISTLVGGYLYCKFSRAIM